MCQLCSKDPDEAMAARESEGAFAEQLERLAAVARGYARGTAKPHDVKESPHRRALAKAVLRRLAEDWI